MSAISLQCGHFDSKFQVEGVVPHQSFLHGQFGQWMPYNFIIDIFHTDVTAEALQAKIGRKSAISLQRGHFDPKFQIAPFPSIIFARLVRPMNVLQLGRWQLSHKTLCSRRSTIFFTEIGRFAFLRPPLVDLGATYDNHLRLIGKCVMDFLLALLELFSLDVTAEALRAIIGWKSAILLQRGPVDPKFQVERVTPHQPFFFSKN